MRNPNCARHTAGALASKVPAIGSIRTLRFADTPLTLAVLATAVAVFSRVGFAINPSLGYMSFTMFL